tara:strand:- start:68 stop:244 length:177 start_codon:yes stop_codon:yes gene_type:complete
MTMIHDDRIDELRKFYLDIKSEDWELLAAGQRVQIIKEEQHSFQILEICIALNQPITI